MKIEERNFYKWKILIYIIIRNNINSITKKNSIGYKVKKIKIMIYI